jgi:hypothetical protein
MKQRFEKYDFDVLLLEGSYVSDPNVRRAVIKNGNDRCSVEEYASRYFRRQGYSALRVENEPVAALFGVFMSPLIQDARSSRSDDRCGTQEAALARGTMYTWKIIVKPVR